MAKAIEQLLILQEYDKEIGRLRREMQDIPLRQQQIESRLSAQKESLAQAEHVLLEARSKIKRVEGEIEAARQQVAKFRAQQLQIKSNEEYRALEKQIASTLQGIRNLEDQELAAMETVEEAQEQVNIRKTALDREKARVDKEVKEFLDRSSGLEEALAGKENERKALAGQVDPVWLSRYERLFAKQKGAVIALVEHGTCGLCHMKLSPSQVVEARKPDTMTMCDFCGRMLYSPQ